MGLSWRESRSPFPHLFSMGWLLIQMTDQMAYNKYESDASPTRGDLERKHALPL
jgi:hypothetical protein